MSVTFMAKSAPERPGADIRARRRQAVIRVNIDGVETAPLLEHDMAFTRILVRGQSTPGREDARGRGSGRCDAIVGRRICAALKEKLTPRHCDFAEFERSYVIFAV